MATNPAETKREGWWLVVYFVASFIYRILILVGILLMISLHYLVFGMILAVVFFFMWIVMPVIKALIYLWSSPRIETRRRRAITVSVGLVAGVFFVLGVMPMPNHFRADGLVRAERFSRVYAGADGRLVNILVPSGSMVKEGTPLLELSNQELSHQLESAAAELQRVEAQARLALSEDPVRYESLKPYSRALADRRARLMEDVASLIIRAPCDGRWLAPDAVLYKGGMLSRGLELGVVQGDGDFYLSAVVKQDDVSRIFTKQQVHHTEVRVRGQEGIVLGVRDFNALPAERESLSSAALGLAGGGSTAVDMNNSRDGGQLAGRGLVGAGQGTKASQPVFEIRAALDSDAADTVKLIHGQRAVARMTLPAEPLLWQWVRAVRQLFQRTYQI
jgi:putative peptide zinc metalloprotease protein